MSSTKNNLPVPGNNTFGSLAKEFATDWVRNSSPRQKTGVIGLFIIGGTTVICVGAKHFFKNGYRYKSSRVTIEPANDNQSKQSQKH